MKWFCYKTFYCKCWCHRAFNLLVLGKAALTELGSIGNGKIHNVSHLCICVLSYWLHCSFLAMLAISGGFLLVYYHTQTVYSSSDKLYTKNRINKAAIYKSYGWHTLADIQFTVNRSILLPHTSEPRYQCKPIFSPLNVSSLVTAKQKQLFIWAGAHSLWSPRQQARFPAVTNRWSLLVGGWGAPCSIPMATSSVVSEKWWHVFFITL